MSPEEYNRYLETLMKAGRYVGPGPELDYTTSAGENMANIAPPPPESYMQYAGDEPDAGGPDVPIGYIEPLGSSGANPDGLQGAASRAAALIGGADPYVARLQGNLTNSPGSLPSHGYGSLYRSPADVPNPVAGSRADMLRQANRLSNDASPSSVVGQLLRSTDPKKSNSAAGAAAQSYQSTLPKIDRDTDYSRITSYYGLGSRSTLTPINGHEISNPNVRYGRGV